jgi:ethanolamine utilization protein EutN
LFVVADDNGVFGNEQRTTNNERSMIIARILGTVVSTQKDERLQGKKLLIVKPINLDGTDQSGYLVAVDTVGAGFHEKVIVVGGSSARMAEGNKECPVDSAIIGVIDEIDYHS